MLHNICGRAKTGKTEYVLEVARKSIENKKHTFFIVPEQSALITERLIIERLGNRSNEYIEVINFKRLCNRVFRKHGGLTQSYVDSAHKLLVMSKAVEACSDMLSEYGGASKNPDFIKKALDAVAEFRMYGVTPKALEDCIKALSGSENEQLCAKLSDFSLLYAQYMHLMREEYSYRDGTDDLERLYEVLCDTNFFSGKTVIIDAFYGFTVPELNIIKRMVQDADDVYITYLLDKERKSLLFERGKKAIGKITEFAISNSVPYEDIQLRYAGGYESPDIKLLEKNFAFEVTGSEKDEQKASNDGSVRIIECKSPYDEARVCCAAVNYFVNSLGARYSDIAICARSADDYYGILDNELAKSGIPFNYNIRYDLLTRPVIAYIISAFEFIKSRSKQAALRLIKTGLTLLTEDEADIAECYIRTWNIQGRLFTDSEWLMNPDGYASAEDMDERARARLEIAENARIKLITPLVAFGEDVKAAECVNDISRAVLKLLENSRYNSDILSDNEIIYHNMVMNALDCMADIMGSEKISAVKYCELFRMIISEYDSGKIPVTIDEVSISDAELHRAAGNKYMIVLGLCDGVFPRTPTADNVFSDRERQSLREAGIELSGSCADALYDELFLAYKVISAPSAGLLMLYSKKSAGGEDSAESCVISMTRSALEGLCSESSDGTDIKLYLCDRALMGEAMRTEIPEFSEAIREYFSQEGTPIKEIGYKQDSYLSEKSAEKLFGKDMLISPSRLEKFNNCACSYFGTYTLGLKPEPVAVLGAAESGNIIHKILELLLCELSEKKQKGEEISEEYAVKREKELLAQYIFELCGGKKAEKNLGGRFKYLYDRLSGALDACVSVMTRELLGAEFIPTDFEMSIGGKGADVEFSSIPINDKNGNTVGTLSINGKIDRTDIYKKDGKIYIKVVDYKTGTKKFSLSDVALGVNLQMLLYLYSLTTSCGLRYGEGEVLPAGVLYTPVHRPGFNIELGEDTDSDEKNSFKPNGILIDDMDVLRAMEKNLDGSFIPVKLKKDGTFYSSSSVTTLETMGRLLSTAAEVASKLAYEMKSGKILKNPYKCDINSCSFCDMAPFCRYEHGEDSARFSMTRYSDEVFEKSSGGDNCG